jgi:endonuclease YncB( thermonuclease family)
LHAFHWTAALLAVLALLIGGPLGHRLALSAGGSASEPQQVHVIDGDTLEIDGELIQLYGIDAPELGQLCERKGKLWPCGLEAALALNKLVSLGGQPVRCAPWEQADQSQADSGLAQVCELGDRNLALTMLRGGYSVALPDSFPDYGEAEREARSANLGLWQGEFVLPWEWRASTGPEVEAVGWQRECNVKGSVTLDGQQVYYVPTDDTYQDLELDPARGELLFCSDEEARAAGWLRPARVAAD